MKTNTTPIWFVLAIALAAGVWFAEKHFSSTAPKTETLLAGLRAAEVTALEIIPAGERKISLIRTNQTWVITDPFDFPAQTVPVESLLVGLEKLSPALRLTAADMKSHPNVDAEFGFENPQYTLDVTAGGQSWHLRIGNKTAPGDAVYVRLVGGAGAFVTDVNWLPLLPRNAVAWRDTSLIAATSTVDWIVITNGAKVIELRADPTNHLWRILRGLPTSARADSSVIAAALQQLRSGHITRFVTDDPKTDLSTFGLQPAELDVWLGRGTNYLDAIHLGKESVENPGQIFARREGWNSVLTVAKESLLPWRGGVNDFRDAHLMEVSTNVTAIEVHGENSFTLTPRGTNGWQVVGETYPVDSRSVQDFLRLLGSLQVSEYVKDVVTGTDLQNFGLATNTRSITLRYGNGATNSFQFGLADTNKVLVKRSDEDFVYAIAPEYADALPQFGWKFREHQLWNFNVTNVAAITLHQDGKTRKIIRNATHWALAPGSQGIVDNTGLEETTKLLSNVAAALWVTNTAVAAELFGFNTNALQVNFEMKTGETNTLDFGAEIQTQAGPSAFAAVTLDGERWTFVFPPVLYQLVPAYLTLSNGPH
jgi:hypothetical protein